MRRKRDGMGEAWRAAPRKITLLTPQAIKGKAMSRPQIRPTESLSNPENIEAADLAATLRTVLRACGVPWYRLPAITARIAAIICDEVRVTPQDDVEAVSKPGSIRTTH